MPEKSPIDEEKIVVGNDVNVSPKRRLVEIIESVVARVMRGLSVESVEKKREIIGTPHDLWLWLQFKFKNNPRGVFIFFKDFALKWDSIEYNFGISAGEFDPNGIKDALRAYLCDILTPKAQLRLREAFLTIHRGKPELASVYADQYIEAAQAVLGILPQINPEMRKRLNGWYKDL